MKNKYSISNILDILWVFNCQFNLDDYINIWGKDLGLHIWRQEGNDIIRIWKSGLNQDQKNKLISYLESIPIDLLIKYLRYIECPICNIKFDYSSSQGADNIQAIKYDGICLKCLSDAEKRNNS